MQKRKVKIRSQLLAVAHQQSFSTEKVLYAKEAQRLKDQGFSVERLFSDEYDHPERESFLYNISWLKPTFMDDFAGELFKETLKSIE